MSITSAIRRAAVVNAHGLAYHDGATPVNWRRSAERIAALAGALRDAGVEPGMRVATLAPNTARHFEVLMAAWWCGAVIVPINTRLATEEIRFIIEHSGARVLACGDVDDPAREAAGSRRNPTTVIELDTGRYDRLITTRQVPDAYPDLSSTAAIFYTGGTTGLPKGVELTHANFLFAAMGMQRDLRHDTRTVYLHATPLFHLADFGTGLGVTLAGGTHSFLPSFSPGAFAERLRTDGVTHTGLVPTMLAALLDSPHGDDDALQHVRSITYGAAPISGTLLARLISAFPRARLQQFYGMTETCGACTTLPMDRHIPSEQGEPKLGTAGAPLPGLEVKIVDSALTEVPRGTPGEIIVRGPTVMRGYWRDAARTAETLVGGWLRTGDVGSMDDEGFISIVDRIKDMIISGGENIASSEVERVLYRLPQVAEAAVVGLPDDRWGERVVAVVVPRPGTTLTFDELRAHCTGLLGGFKIPKQLVLQDSLPRNPSGKVLKRVLRDELTKAG